MNFRLNLNEIKVDQIIPSWKKDGDVLSTTSKTTVPYESFKSQKENLTKSASMYDRKCYSNRHKHSSNKGKVKKFALLMFALILLKTINVAALTPQF